MILHVFEYYACAANVNLQNLHRVLSSYPRAPCAGIVDFVLAAGAPFKKGDLLAVLRGMNGARRAEVASPDINIYVNTCVRVLKTLAK